MSIKIRLAKTGKKNNPTYKVVVSNTRDKRNGKLLDVLGTYNPMQNQGKAVIDTKKIEEWKLKGAGITKAVEDLLSGTYKFTKYNPKADKEAAQA